MTISQERADIIVNAYIESLHHQPEPHEIQRMIEKDPVKGISATSRAEISNFSKEGLFNKLISKHKWPNASAPFGYKIDKNKYLTIDKKRAKIVKQIFDKYLELQSTPDVAFQLEKEFGIKKDKSKIRYILRNPIYIGIYHVSDETAYFEELQIVDENIFLKVQEILPKRKEKKPMDGERKRKTVDRIFDQYMKILDSGETVGPVIPNNNYRKGENHPGARRAKKHRLDPKKRIDGLTIERDTLQNLFGTNSLAKIDPNLHNALSGICNDLKSIRNQLKEKQPIKEDTVTILHEDIGMLENIIGKGGS